MFANGSEFRLNLYNALEMPETRTICLPYRFGDCILLLPLAKHWHDQGHRIQWLVHHDFIGLFDGVSYVDAKPFDGNMKDQDGAIQSAHESFADVGRIICPKADHNPLPMKHKTTSFSTELWQRCGEAVGESVLDLYHQLPLIFDRRDMMREFLLRSKHWPQSDKPVLAYNFTCHSQIKHARRGVEWEASLKRLNAEHGEPYALLNLGEIRAERIYDMLAFIESAAVLLTVDTALTHLARATTTPVLNIVAPEPWYQPEVQRNWAAVATLDKFDESYIRHWLFTWTATERQERMGGHCRSPEAMRYTNIDFPDPRSIIHFNHSWYATEREEKRNNTASWTWEHLRAIDRGWMNIVYREEDVIRNGSTIGDKRKLPFVKDMIDWAVSKSWEGSILCLTNTDNCLTPEAPYVIREHMVKGDCCYSRRVDVADAKIPYTRDMLARSKSYAGKDLFAFTPDWWRRHRDDFPDLLLGCEGWDHVMSVLMNASSEHAKIDPPIVYHERHTPYWSRAPRNDPGQAHNRRLCIQWAVKSGHKNHLTSGRYLFAAIA